ncbi:MAG: TIGR00730 family Rossman fold protein [Bacteroidales bacterium]|nr:TIGR00730 family Rossman fold protein [Bacteroidales bacterium]
MKYQSVALFCGSAEGNNPVYAQEAAKFGQLCAERELTLYYGGGCIGLMGAAAKAMMARQGKVIGVAPDFFANGEVLSDDITEMIHVKTMSERKQLIERQADAFVIFPGGYGTMDEFFEVLTDAQLGLHYKPIVLYNYNGFFDPLVAQLKRFLEEGFLRPFHFGLLIVATNMDELFNGLDNYTNTNDHTWLSKIKK